MIRVYLLAAASLLIMSAGDVCAQVGYGTQIGNISTGGSLAVGGAVTNGATGVRLGVNAGFSQLVRIDTFTFASGSFASGNPGLSAFGNPQSGVTARGNPQMSFPSRAQPRPQPRPQPTPQQFVEAASRFDQDHDGLLDRKELAKVGLAVMAELRRQGSSNQALYARSGAANTSKAKQPARSVIDTFVTQCLTFDDDDDDALDAAETKRMAAALIRSLSGAA